MQESVIEKVDAPGQGTIKQFNTFRLSGRLFGVDILDVKEITRELEFTPIYHAAKEVWGYVNIRGQIYLVLDMRLLLGFEKKESDSDSCIIFFKQKVAEPFGVLVDKIGDVVDVPEDKIEGKLKVGDAISSADLDLFAGADNLINGVCKLQDDLLVTLNAYKFISAIES